MNANPERSWPSYPDLEGKCAAIVGGAGGIGKAVAVALARSGCRLALLELPGRSELARKVAREIEAEGAEAEAFPCDVVDPRSIAESFGMIKERFGSPRIVVNSAGTIVRKPALEITEQDWDSVLDVCLKGAFFVCQQAASQMIESGGGSIINVSSIFGLVGVANRAPYVASKAGIINLSRALAVEWHDHQIRVNAIAPAFVRTPMTEGLLTRGLDVVNKALLRPLAETSDVAAAALFLASDAASAMITGQTIQVDGGWTIW